jgi:hypothetical protein
LAAQVKLSLQTLDLQLRLEELLLHCLHGGVTRGKGCSFGRLRVDGDHPAEAGRVWAIRKQCHGTLAEVPYLRYDGFCLERVGDGCQVDVLIQGVRLEEVV